MAVQKKIFILWFGVFCCTLAAAQTMPIPNPLYLRTQSDVDSFPLKYGLVQVLSGSLVVGSLDSSIYSDINDLSPLASLRLVWTSLLLLYNPQLQSLHGLEALDTVFLNLAIVGNPQLQDLGGLDGLRDVHYQLFIEDNDGLQNLTGLDSLHTVASGISIKANPGLRSLQGLGAVGDGGYLEIIDNDRLESLAGMDGMHAASVVEITENDGLKTLAGMDGLKTASILIRDNDSLENCAGFPALYKMFTLRIEQNPQLLHIGNFGSSDSLEVGRLFIQDNPRIRTLDGLQHLSKLLLSANVERNDSLQSLYGLDVKRIAPPYSAATDLYILDNPSLTELALNHLRVIGRPAEANNSHVDIRRNRSLKSLDGFAMLDSCHARLVIGSNDSLKTIDLPSLRYAYDISMGTDSVEECRVGPFENLEYVEKNLSIYRSKYIDGFPNFKRVGQLMFIPNNGYIRGFNQMQDANDIGIQGSTRVVDGFHNMRRGGGIGCYWVKDSLLAFEQLDTLLVPNTIYGGLAFRIYDQCYYDSAFSKVQYIHRSFGLTSWGEPDAASLGNHLPHFTDLKKIGFQLLVYNNLFSLRSINAFPQLTQVGPPIYHHYDPGGVFIYGNSLLQSLDGLEHLTKIVGKVDIYANDSLTDCSALCPVLQHAVISGPVTIHDNPFPCGGQPEILAWCDTAYVSTGGPQEALPFELWPNPTTGGVRVQLPDGAAQSCTASLYDLGGRMLWQAETGGVGSEFMLPDFPAGIYVFLVQSGGQRGWRRLVLLPR